MDHVKATKKSHPALMLKDVLKLAGKTYKKVKKTGKTLVKKAKKSKSKKAKSKRSKSKKSKSKK